MATVGFGVLELMLIFIFSAAGQSTDLVSQLSPHDYFKTQGIDVSTDKMVEIIGKEPTDGASQIAQLLALRILGEDGAFKQAPNYAAQRKIIEEVAAGKKGQDKLGFARDHALRAWLTWMAPVQPSFPSRTVPKA